MGSIAGYQLREFNAASLTGAYQAIGAVLNSPGYHMTITNNSDVDVYISTDGVTNDIRIPEGTSIVFRSQTTWNGTPNAVYILQKNKSLYIKQVTAAGTGSIVANILTET